MPTRPGYNFAGWYCRVE
ncbi:MAG: hypothetical protein II395_10610, partial [Ruminococcus sp.]|nr:hypothetical protein [Ruminococcus sp.]